MGNGRGPSALLPAALGSGWFRLMRLARFRPSVPTKSTDTTHTFAKIFCAPTPNWWIVVFGESRSAPRSTARVRSMREGSR